MHFFYSLESNLSHVFSLMCKSSFLNAKKFRTENDSATHICMSLM